MPRSRFVLPCLALLLFFSAIARAGWMGNIQVEFPSPAYLGHMQHVHITFDYDISEPAGAYFSVLPLSGGAASPGAGWSGSALYPAGNGSASLWCTVTSGECWVDQIRLQMKSADWSQTLLTIVVPVHYHFGPHGVAPVTPDVTSPSVLVNGTSLHIAFGTYTENTDGALVFIRPYVDGHLAGGYGASGGAVVASGFDSGSQHFTYFTGEHAVDALHVKMTTPDQSAVLLEFDVPVDYRWENHGLSNITLAPQPPAFLPWQYHVTAEFDYATALGDTALAYAIGSPITNILYQPSEPLLPPSGHVSRYWTVGEMSEPTDQTGTYLYLLPFNVPDPPYPWEVTVYLATAYHFGPHAIHDITFSPGEPAILDNDQHVTVQFTYDTTAPDGVRIWAMPYHDGQVVGWYSASALLPSGTGTASRIFGANTGDTPVDQVRFLMVDSTRNTLLDFFVDTRFFFGSQGTVVTVPDVPGRPVLLPNIPNPFNPTTRIAFDLPRPGRTRLTVYDLAGRRVRCLLDGTAPAGRTELTWRGRDDTGRVVPSGVYLYRLETADTVLCRRMVLVR